MRFCHGHGHRYTAMRLGPRFVGGVCHVPIAKRGEIVAWAQVDHDDWPLVASRAWHFNGYGYARSVVDRREVLMHRLVMGFEHGDGRMVDHINRDKLDNRRANLRESSHALNAQNQGARASSGFRGVHWDKNQRRWQAQVGLDGRLHYLGTFDSREDAAAAASDFRARYMPHSPDAAEVF